MRYLLVILTIFLFSCSSSKKDEYKPYDKISAVKEYERAMEYFDERNYHTSLTAFEDISKKYALHAIARNSLQMEIFMNFVLEKYTESAAIAEVFIKFYPLDREGIEYAEYMRIRSGVALMPDFYITSNYPKETLILATNFLTKYPNSRYIENIKTQYKKINEHIVNNILIVADRHAKTNNYIAAILEYQSAMKYAKNNNDEKMITNLKEKKDRMQNIIFTSNFDT